MPEPQDYAMMACPVNPPCGALMRPPPARRLARRQRSCWPRCRSVAPSARDSILAWPRLQVAAGLIEPRQPEERAEDEGDALGLYFADIARGALIVAQEPFAAVAVHDMGELVKAGLVNGSV